MVKLPTSEERLIRAKLLVVAAEEEMLLAIMFHETWKPTAYDGDLRARIGGSYAAHTFEIIRLALRREVVMALMRLWDDHRQALKLNSIVDVLQSAECFDGLMRERIAAVGATEEEADTLRDTHRKFRDDMVALVRKHTHSNDPSPLLDRLRTIRHERLAHRQAEQPTDPAGLLATDEEVEDLYQDSRRIINYMALLLLGRSFYLALDSGRPYRESARYFWESVRGEGAEGHPRFEGARRWRPL
ncbi:hypothetical protein VI03_10130 [Burkholderia vietnamiensis]|nr:hypothetical protein VI03_10130 [Burkholderia vietnamiensis]MBR7913281.1 hypothetical protein [Burkholderia vietnamiensis]HDR9275780.1 hypothetical protein [Burkholderia vietnamiensis]